MAGRLPLTNDRYRLRRLQALRLATGEAHRFRLGRFLYGRRREGDDPRVEMFADQLFGRCGRRLRERLEKSGVDVGGKKLTATTFDQSAILPRFGGCHLFTSMVLGHDCRNRSLRVFLSTDQPAAPAIATPGKVS